MGSPRPGGLNPRPGLRFLEATPDGRGYLVEIVGGPHDGDLLFVPGPPPAHLTERAVAGGRYIPPPLSYDDLTPTERREAQATAERLLLALLDEGQQADYRATGGFWVELADGRLRLGTLFHLVWRPHTGPDLERILCVVPEGDLGLTPPADIWTNLLLTLGATPERFFAVANVLRVTRRPSSHRAPAYSSLGLEALSTLARRHYLSGDLFSGALAEHALARRLAASGRRRTALRCAVPAAMAALVADVPEHFDGPALRGQLVATAHQLAGAVDSPAVLAELVTLADRRVRTRRPDWASRLDAARSELDPGPTP